MSERDRILIELVKEVLGPRDGPLEILPPDQDPRDEYITGVLAPARAARRPDDIDADIDEIVIDPDVEDMVDETSSEEDQDTQGYAVVPGVFSPALDPRAQPRSIGLSFTLEAADGPPQIAACATWARYYQEHQGWRREPAIFLTGAVLADGAHEWTAGPGVSLQMRARQLNGGAWKVSLFLVNITEIDDKERPRTPDYLFQPQIRVHCRPGTVLVPVWTADGVAPTTLAPDSMAAEDASLALLYRERVALARGHLCGATWTEIDPERPHPSIPSPPVAPFSWTDIDLASTADRATFAPADLRTELVPCYPVEAPEPGWEDRCGPSPTLDPLALAESWWPHQVRDSLQPLVDGYRAWLDGQRTMATGLAPAQQPVAGAHLQQCQDAADRLQEAIAILVDDEDMRLAFCFANRAIALQSQWNRRGRVLTWYPFQLAFILLNIPALSRPDHPDRDICDLLWFPTGGGKTEAYLGLAALSLALRRRRAGHHQTGDRTGAGVGVLSRYTLRLLTIQQFRRALGVITACEYLRVDNLERRDAPTGWRPRDCTVADSFLWGGARFSAGLWVGGGVTPNGLHSIGPLPGPGGMRYYAGALDILRGAARDYNGPHQRLRQAIQGAQHVSIDGEPAQVLTCPCCRAILAVADEGLDPGQHTLHFVVQGGRPTAPLTGAFRPPLAGLTVDAAILTPHKTAGYRTLSLTVTVPLRVHLRAREVDDWWHGVLAPALGNPLLLAARPARPGYFIQTYDNQQNHSIPCDFDVYCPDPTCDLNAHAWAERAPLSRSPRAASPDDQGQLLPGMTETAPASAGPASADAQWQETPEWGRMGRGRLISGRIPIPALTVDDQVFHRCPSLVIATVDKFARLAFEPKAASLFGNVTHYHGRWGYYRAGAPPSWGALPPSYRPHPPGHGRTPLHIPVPPFAPPDLILQDELHLIEGPLGSMVGLYETTVDLLCQRQQGGESVIPKYVASTATVRQAESQVRALYNRRLAQFPPPALSADDRFFARDREVHPLDSARPGRLYVAVCAPGKGAQTPIVRLWSALLQHAYEIWQASPTPAADHLWTLAGYFNAIRELAGAVSLFRQDIPERLTFRAGSAARPLDRSLELSSRKSSLDLPTLLESLMQPAPGAQDAVFATSMFGTGVDVGIVGAC